MKRVYYLFSNIICILLLSNITLAQIGVEGQVKDEAGNPLVGVNVLVKGTNSGSITDSNGEFSIVTPNKNSTLVFSFIGFKTSGIFFKRKI